jgi:hypothetical protein
VVFNKCHEVTVPGRVRSPSQSEGISSVSNEDQMKGQTWDGGAHVPYICRRKHILHSSLRTA